MDNKTAMQELISWLKEVDAPSGIIKQAESQLPKERKQIEEAYMDSTLQFDNASPIINPKTPSEYYNQTYTQNN